MYFDHKAYGNRIKRLRRSKGLTQEQLAEKLRVSRTYIGKIEKGSQVGPIELAGELAVFFDVPLEHLLLGNECPTNNRRRGLQRIIAFLSELEAELGTGL